MLKRLRVKFICINMAIVAVMLCIILGMVLHSTQRNMEMESFRALQSAVSMKDRGLHRELPGGPEGEALRGCFVAEIGRDGEITRLEGFYLDFTSGSAAQTIGLVENTLACGENTGILEEYGLRYLRQNIPEGMRIAYRDVTGEREMQQAMVRTVLLIGGGSLLIFFVISLLLGRWAVRPVEQAWQQQRQFVADASHELKTPLTVILTNAEFLEDEGYTPAERKNFSHSILTMAHQMRGLVESLLELARVDAGALQTEKEPFDLSKTVEEAILPFEPLFFEQGLRLSAEVEAGIRISGSEPRLRQAAEILLDNAQKYSAPGGETVISLRRCGHNRCVLAVSNDGEPILKEELPNLFKRFYRADPARSMNHSYGLGLAIAQGIAEEHKGRIWAESGDGKNRFCMELPIL